MRRTVLSAIALACTAVLASTVPAFADGATPVPSTAAPDPSAPAEEPQAPSAVPTTSAEPADEVSVVPSGAPDTGVTPTSSQSGTEGELIGGGAVAVLAVGGAAVYLVRRRRATGA